MHVLTEKGGGRVRLKEYQTYRCVQLGHLLRCQPLSRKQLRWWADQLNRAPLSGKKRETAKVQQERAPNTERYSTFTITPGPQWINSSFITNKIATHTLRYIFFCRRHPLLGSPSHTVSQCYHLEWDLSCFHRGN